MSFISRGISAAILRPLPSNPPIARRTVGGTPRSGSGEDLPAELQGLRLNEDGLLVDEKTGEVINEYGATRFDVAVRALRGDFDPPPGVENTERTPGVLLDSLVQWPTVYEFKFVVRSDDMPAEAVVEELRARVEAVCQWAIASDACSARERKGGKYLSICIPVTVRAPDIIQRVLDSFADDERILMKY